MIRRMIFMAVLTLLVMVLAAPAGAHSTRGRLKIPLEKAVLEIDDVAYFFESYVHRQLYRDRFEKSQRRFYVKKFVRIDQSGPGAVVHFITLDVKGKCEFADHMVINRGSDGLWRFSPAHGGDSVPLYTYVKKWRYYYKTCILPVSAGGLLVALVFFGWLRRRRATTNASDG